MQLRHGRSQARLRKEEVERGASTPSRKENYATETCTTSETNTAVLEEAGPGLPGRIT